MPASARGISRVRTPPQSNTAPCLQLISGDTVRSGPSLFRDRRLSGLPRWRSVAALRGVLAGVLAARVPAPDRLQLAWPRPVFRGDFRYDHGGHQIHFGDRGNAPIEPARCTRSLSFSSDEPAREPYLWRAEPVPGGSTTLVARATGVYSGDISGIAAATKPRSPRLLASPPRVIASLSDCSRSGPANSAGAC